MWVNFLLSALDTLTSSSQFANGNPLSKLIRYGRIFCACWKPESRKYIPRAKTASCPLWSIWKNVSWKSEGQKLNNFST